jgi:hypothetical protein
MPTPTHAEKKQGTARIISFKTSKYRRFWLLACVIAQLVGLRAQEVQADGVHRRGKMCQVASSNSK